MSDADDDSLLLAQLNRLLDDNQKELQRVRDEHVEGS